MKRWGWLFAVSWIVSFSSSTGKYVVDQWVDGGSLMFPCLTDEKFICEDMAEALNEAHERRTTPEPTILPYAPVNPNGMMGQ